MEWTSINDKEPEKDRPFLGYVLVGYYFYGMKEDRSKEINTCIWNDSNKRFEEYCNCSGYERDQEYIEVLYWMPLPPPPKD